MTGDIPKTETRTVLCSAHAPRGLRFPGNEKRRAEGPVWLRHGAQTHLDSILLGSGSWEQVFFFGIEVIFFSRTLFNVQTPNASIRRNFSPSYG